MKTEVLTWVVALAIGNFSTPAPYRSEIWWWCSGSLKVDTQNCESDRKRLRYRQKPGVEIYCTPSLQALSKDDLKRCRRGGALPADISIPPDDNEELKPAPEKIIETAPNPEPDPRKKKTEKKNDKKDKKARRSKKEKND